FKYFQGDIVFTNSLHIPTKTCCVSDHCTSASCSLTEGSSNHKATIDDCTSPFKWVWIATCSDQTVQNQRYIVCEFGTLPEGLYRLGYFSHYRNCLIGLSKTFRVTEQPTN
ncbi:hypothetical protein COOONC_02356, partial [Cooperia oncophora]